MLLNQVRRFWVVVVLFWAGPALAGPTLQFEDSVLEIIGELTDGWVDSVMQPQAGGQEVLSEQIFTEISPLLDSPEAVKLPEDQLLAD